MIRKLSMVLVMLAAAALILGHVAMTDPNRRLSAGPITRRLFAFGGTLVVVATVSGHSLSLPEQPLARGMTVAGVLVASVVLHRGIAFIFDNALYLYNLETDEARRLTDNDAINTHPTWAPYGAARLQEIAANPTPDSDNLGNNLPTNSRREE